ncbi:outer membrane beta-barrel protein [Echinicola sp. CAU 1574]|uniref:Outer membrane beta-barrel protein n=1 Tax=Echinicola arenosa TaxID=2774144 RepID=A0ABR9AH97_9BACT|nr:MULTISPECIES: outer membrane beta-barrel protein [Echinicola]MBD8488122.1 outer membrane beta-barrel protein [Echinicola arenosa]
MKRYLLAVIFMALIQTAFGYDSTSVAAKDSIIVEYGHSGKIVILVDNKEDFQKLKALDVNQIIRELDLELDEESGELTVVEIKDKDGKGKEIVRVEEGGAETAVSVGRLKVIVDESGPNTQVRIEKRKKVEPPFRTYFNVDLGINNYLREGGGFPTSDDPYAVKGWGSWNVGLNWMASQRLSKGFYWDFGLGVQWYNFKFENRDYQAVRGDESVEFIQRTDVDGFKSKVSASYITAMTLLKLDFGRMNDNGEKGLKIAAGPYFGYRVGGRSKYVYRELDGSGRHKDKLNTGIYLNNVRYGIRGEIGVGRVTFFSTYDLNELFQDEKGPALNPIVFGLVF